ncbi:MAG TPA: ribonuclease J [Clostridiales bacterium]|nr:ribonuclease J [Clostridiales bacterium]
MSQKKRKKSAGQTGKLKVIPLGGLGEIGKNITVIEYGNDVLVVDCGLSFPDDDMLGIDLVIPDISWLVKQKDRIRGIVLTHGHEDHIGALPYFLKEINVPVYGTRLTIGLVKLKLEEHGILERSTLVVIDHHHSVDLGIFTVEFIPVCHSIPDSTALAIYTPVGTLLHSGDFKIDHTPIDEVPMDLSRIAEIGKSGVLLLMCDSTNVERRGYTMSESTVGESFEQLFMEAGGRILVTTFASNVHRIQQVVDAAYKFNRKVAIAGRSMEKVVSLAMELGYIKIPPDCLISLDRINRHNPEHLCIITTGSQGEPMSALTRIAASEYKRVEIGYGDTVVISASAIPGNEKLISRVINDLFKKGADVVYEKLAEIHVSGHAHEEELKILHSLVKPRFFMPVHGEYRHLVHHARLAQNLGLPRDRIFIMETGNVLELNGEEAMVSGSVNSGKILVDGLGVGDVSGMVLRDRKHLAEDGMVVVVITVEGSSGSILAGPDIISRGFVNTRDSDDLIGKMREVILTALRYCEEKGKHDWSTRKLVIKDKLREYILDNTKRKPMILPVIMEI